MKLTLALTAAGIALALSASPAAAQCCPISVPQAPNTYGPCYYAVNCYNQWYGPNYCLRPCHPPFQGMVFPPKEEKKAPPPQGAPPFCPPGSPPGAPFAGPGPGMPGYPGIPHAPGHMHNMPPIPMVPYPQKGPPQPPRFVNHPFARSPRDFFMMD